jgi:small subunit ribosomal protein S8
MSLSDPIADMLTCVRNAHMAGLEQLDVPHSRMKSEIARILKKEGYITDFVVEGGIKKVLRLYLKYTDEHKPVITGIQRESRPGLRKYAGAKEVPSILGGLGTAIVSTSSGVMTDKDARARKIGGEILCRIW